MIKIIQLGETDYVEYVIQPEKHRIQASVYVDNEWKGSINFNMKQDVKLSEKDLDDFTEKEAYILYNHIIEELDDGQE